MKLSLVALSALSLLPLAAGVARADDAAVACVDGKFGDHVENGHVAGDAKSIATAHKAVYWIDVANTGDASQITLVWSVDGKEVQRQALDVGRSPHWRTWGARPLSPSVKTVTVQVLDASGKSLKEDSLAFDPS